MEAEQKLREILGQTKAPDHVINQTAALLRMAVVQPTQAIGIPGWEARANNLSATDPTKDGALRVLAEMLAQQAIEGLIERAPDGWQGTEPTEGTRRHLIGQVIDQHLVSLVTPSRRASLRDAVESALLERTIADEEAQEDGGLEPEEAAALRGSDLTTAPDEFDCAVAACDQLYRRLTDGPATNPAELARVIDILRHGVHR